MTDVERLSRIQELRQRMAEIRARLPRHTPPTAMMVELDELEDEMARLERGQHRSNMTAALPSGFHARPATMADADAMADLFCDYWEVIYGIRMISHDDMRRWLSGPGFDVATSTHLVFSPDGRLAAFIAVSDEASPPVHAEVWGCVRPEFEGRGIGAYLIEWAEERARQAIARVPKGLRVAIRLNTGSAHERTQRLFAKMGLREVRRSYIMAIDLDKTPPPAHWPAGIVVRTFKDNPDLRAVWRAKNEAFQDHWGHVGKDEEESLQYWRHNMDNDPAFDPSLWFLAMDGGEIAAVALCSAFTGENKDMGWVETLGVRRPWRRKGLALALLHHVFDEFRRRGRTQVALGVDAQSLTGATRLYEKAGMHVAREEITYEKELRPGKELGLQMLDRTQVGSN